MASQRASPGGGNQRNGQSAVSIFTLRMTRSATVSMSTRTDKQHALRPATRERGAQSVPIQTPSDLFRCLVTSSSEQRLELFRLAAEAESWRVISCHGVTEFMRKLFRERVPLTIVDLPLPAAQNYSDLRGAAERVREAGDSLLMVSGMTDDPSEEIWARQLGAWVYLPMPDDSQGLEWVFCEARKALLEQGLGLPRSSEKP